MLVSNTFLVDSMTCLVYTILIVLQEAYMVLGGATDTVFKQQETYNNILKTDSQKITAERDVFHRFFTKPQALLKDLKVLQNNAKSKTGQPTPRKTPRRRLGAAAVPK